MAVNKVIFGNQTVMDITDSTVTENTLTAGAVAYNAAGVRIVGRNDVEAAFESIGLYIDSGAFYILESGNE